MCTECNFKTRKKISLVRHYKMFHQKEPRKGNPISTKQSSNVTSNTNEITSLIRLNTEKSQTFRSLDENYENDSYSSGDIRETKQSEDKPIIIKFVSKKRRLQLDKNEAVMKNDDEFETLASITKSESLKRSRLTLEEKTTPNDEDIFIKSNALNVKSIPKTDSHNLFHSQSSYLFRSIVASSKSSKDESSKKRVRWAEWIMVMENGQKKIVAINSSQHAQNDDEMTEYSVKEKEDSVRNSSDLYAPDKIKDCNAKILKGVWILKGFKCMYCDFKSTERSLLDAHHKAEHTSQSESQQIAEQDIPIKTRHVFEPVPNRSKNGNCFQCIKRQYLKRQYDSKSSSSSDESKNNDSVSNISSNRRRKSSHRSSSIQDIENPVILLKYKNDVSLDKLKQNSIGTKNRTLNKCMEEINSNVIPKVSALNIEARNLLCLKEELSDDVNSLSSYSSIEESTGNLKGTFLKDLESYQRTLLRTKETSEQKLYQKHPVLHTETVNSNRNFKHLENWVAAQQRGFQQFEENVRNQNMILKKLFSKKNLNHRLKDCSVKLKRFDKF